MSASTITPGDVAENPGPASPGPTSPDAAASQPAAPDPAPEPADLLAQKLLGALIGAMELFSIHVGRETGLYEALADFEAASIPELADAASLDQRYVDQWLHQQAAVGLVTVDDAQASSADRRHHLPAHVEEVLLDDSSLRQVGRAGTFLVGIGRAMPDLVEAFRTGAGVPYADYGPEFRHAIASFNRPIFDTELGGHWLPGVPVVHDALRGADTPRILDVGSGLGASTLALARTYPHALVWGVDLDEASVGEARDAAARAGLADRVRFVHADALSFDPGARFDLVTWFESLHDTADPVAALANVRNLLAPGGHVLVGDGRGQETFTAPAGPIERLLYGFSVLHCVPAAREDGSEHVHGLVVRSEEARWAPGPRSECSDRWKSRSTGVPSRSPAHRTACCWWHWRWPEVASSHWTGWPMPSGATSPRHHWTTACSRTSPGCGRCLACRTSSSGSCPATGWTWRPTTSTCCGPNGWSGRHGTSIRARPSSCWTRPWVPGAATTWPGSTSIPSTATTSMPGPCDSRRWRHEGGPTSPWATPPRPSTTSRRSWGASPCAVRPPATSSEPWRPSGGSPTPTRSTSATAATSPTNWAWIRPRASRPPTPLCSAASWPPWTKLPWTVPRRPSPTGDIGRPHRDGGTATAATADGPPRS